MFKAMSFSVEVIVLFLLLVAATAGDTANRYRDILDNFGGLLELLDKLKS